MTYYERVSYQLDTLDFDGKRLALAALDIRVFTNGRDWQLKGNWVRV